MRNKSYIDSPRVTHLKNFDLKRIKADLIQSAPYLWQHKLIAKLNMFTSIFCDEFLGYNNVYTFEFTFHEKLLSKRVFANDNI